MFISLFYTNYLESVSMQGYTKDDVLRLIPYILEQYVYIERTKPA